jgi:HAD superfamily hydrolase (TIGR01509 family)
MVAHVRAEGTPLPGALDAITVARAAGCKVGIASSSSREMIEAVVDSLGIGGQVDALCTADDEERGKPDPAVYLSAARLLEAAPVDCVAIEDSPWGVRSAKAAGMVCVGVRTPAVDASSIAEADVVIESLLDFTPKLLSTLDAADVALDGRSGRSTDGDRP